MVTCLYNLYGVPCVRYILTTLKRKGYSTRPRSGREAFFSSFLSALLGNSRHRLNFSVFPKRTFRDRKNTFSPIKNCYVYLYFWSLRLCRSSVPVAYGGSLWRHAGSVMATFVPLRRSKRARLDLGALRATKTAAALAQLRVSGPCCGSLRRKDPMGLAVRLKPAAQGSSGGSPARRKPARRAAARPQHGGEGGGSRLVSPSKSRKQVSAHRAVGAVGSGCCDRTVSMFIVSMIVSLKRFAVYRPHHCAQTHK